MIKRPDLRYEKKLWRKGYKLIAGADEVGRGSLAGPVVAAAVVFTPDKIFEEEIVIDDSKKLTPKRRIQASQWIKKNAHTWGVGEVSTSLINRIGMAKATKMAFRRAIKEANSKIAKPGIDFLLIDAFYLPYTKGLRRKNQLAIINGDEKSISIAAASIIAKVYRDKLMVSLGKEARFKNYGWQRNKGYGTVFHKKAIVKYGVTRYHRKKFLRNLILIP